MWRPVKILSTWTGGIFQPWQLSIPFNIKNPNSVAMAAKARGVSACLPEWGRGNHTRDWIVLTLRNGNERSSDLFTVSLDFTQTSRQSDQRQKLQNCVIVLLSASQFAAVPQLSEGIVLYQIATTVLNWLDFGVSLVRSLSSLSKKGLSCTLHSRKSVSYKIYAQQSHFLEYWHY